MTQFMLTKESPEIIRFFRNISTLSKMLDDQEQNLRPVLNDYRMNGRLPYYKIGGRLLYKEKDTMCELSRVIHYFNLTKASIYNII